MPEAHRNGDSRACGAVTVVSGQNFVFVDDELWAVAGDQNSHGGGGLIASGTTITINGTPVIVNGDSAGADALCLPIGPPHCAPDATQGSGVTNAY